jgi:hypothetical protein
MIGNGGSGNGKIMLTPEGGLAVQVVNNTGASSVKGTIVEASKSVDNAVALAAVDDVDPFGIVYSDAVDDGENIWVVISGIAEVLYSTTVTRGTFARVPIAADGGQAGYAIAEALPVPPLATNKHFQEIGHPLESIGAPGLAKTVLHFN